MNDRNGSTREYMVDLSHPYYIDGTWIITGPTGWGKSMIISIIDSISNPIMRKSLKDKYFHILNDVIVKFDNGKRVEIRKSCNPDSYKFTWDNDLKAKGVDKFASVLKYKDNVPKYLKYKDDIEADVLNNINGWLNAFDMTHFAFKKYPDTSTIELLVNSKFLEEYDRFSSGETSVLNMMWWILECWCDRKKTIMVGDDLGRDFHSIINVDIVKMINVCKPDDVQCIMTTNHAVAVGGIWKRVQDLYENYKKDIDEE